MEIMEQQKQDAPRYLYKVLSYRLWQATQNRKTVQLSAADDRFIHLSTEDQLDKIIAKYFSGASKYVILKLETDKLDGRLVFESNPGGSSKYYHLYQGFIPFSAIVESKVVHNQTM